MSNGAVGILVALADGPRAGGWVTENPRSKVAAKHGSLTLQLTCGRYTYVALTDCPAARAISNQRPARGLPWPGLPCRAIDEPPVTSPTPRFQYDFGRNFAEVQFFPPPQRTRIGRRPDRFWREWPVRSGNGRTADCGAIDLMTPMAIRSSPVTDEIPQIPHQWQSGQVP